MLQEKERESYMQDPKMIQCINLRGKHGCPFLQSFKFNYDVI